MKFYLVINKDDHAADFTSIFSEHSDIISFIFMSDWAYSGTLG